jgi:type I restriction-modification system DNA methylase subunit
MTAPAEVVDLVGRFSEHVDGYRSGNYNETQLRRDYLDGLLKALGWDVDNSQGFAEAYRDVIHEDAVRIGEHLKSPDYSCRVGGLRKFFIEAKRPSVDVRHDGSAAYQLRRYAWSAKLPVSILTNFAALAVYDCRIRPVIDDKSTVARIRFWTFDEYIDNWDEIQSVFSKTAVLKGSFDKYAISSKGKKGTAQVDDAFLDEIESWRTHLAKDIAKNNDSLSQQDLNWAVQQTIDRIIFLRIAEDRGLEAYGQLQSLSKGRKVYSRLNEIYRKADQRYNSGLFHFETETGRNEQTDTLTPGLVIGDDTLQEIFGNLYYPESPYEFSVFGADILGSVYERFLGKVIRLTAGHHAKVEEKPEVKKAGGVFYTPTYIVSYIVRSTIGELVKGKTPKQAGELRILDPACGSGSFLLGAYQFLLDWHRDYYVKDGVEKNSKGKTPKLHRGRGGAPRLTTSERKRILTDCIFGVDVDAQAVEVTKLSLLLKVLEGETQFEMFHERVLPDLGGNIKCGNSLVNRSLYDDDFFAEASKAVGAKVNTFDWDREFPAITAAGGFDTVIGNPPYISALALSKLLDPRVKSYWKENYVTAKGTYDIYVLFFERALALARNGGYVSFITPNKFLSAPYAQALRQEFLGNHSLDSIADYSAVPVFDTASVYPVVTLLRPRIEFSGHINIVRAHGENDTVGPELSVATSDLRRFPENIWGTLLGPHTELCARIYQRCCTLETVATVQATSTAAEADHYSAYIHEGTEGRQNKRLVNTGTIDRYASLWGVHKLANKGAQYERPVLALENVSATRSAMYSARKIIVAKMAKVLECFLDAEGTYASINTNCIYAPTTSRSLQFLTGLLNSTLVSFVYSQLFSALKMSGGYFQFQAPQLKLIPIPSVDDERQELIEILVAKSSVTNSELLAARSPHEIEKWRRELDGIDRNIDAHVFALYGLSDQDVANIFAAEQSRLKPKPRKRPQ